ncbi:MAG: 1-(5-phosphoribosyl)-5-[(5-phosphoribosylamino)methylideneamino]imidazole-4-carboxamide isomerase [Bacteroidales bacterium]|nr:1-(5-phosphoribosyl)-5-[(5-phosphoribosylamino)methylideneamino]imidazole-4-carboxamide isomerase [Bacteroidales bacterium]
MIQIIPAIDIIGGECVRLTQGDYDQKKTYFKDPLEVAKMFEEAGIRRLHVVDLDGAKASVPQNLKVLERIASGTGLEVEFGGGIKSGEALSSVLNAGARYAICGSIAVTAPEEFDSWLKQFGGDRIVLGVDTKNGFVATHGWLKSSALTASDLISKFTGSGLKQVICTEISHDGMLQGVDSTIYTGMQSEFPDIKVIVSGGISCVDDILGLDKLGLKAVIVGKAFYEGRITIEDLKKLSRC